MAGERAGWFSRFNLVFFSYTQPLASTGKKVCRAVHTIRTSWRVLTAGELAHIYLPRRFRLALLRTTEHWTEHHWAASSWTPLSCSLEASSTLSRFRLLHFQCLPPDTLLALSPRSGSLRVLGLSVFWAGRLLPTIGVQRCVCELTISGQKRASSICLWCAGKPAIQFTRTRFPTCFERETLNQWNRPKALSRLSETGVVVVRRMSHPEWQSTVCSPGL